MRRRSFLSFIGLAGLGAAAPLPAPKTATVAQYSSYIKVTCIEDAAFLLGQQAALSIDEMIREALDKPRLLCYNNKTIEVSRI